MLTLKHSFQATKSYHLYIENGVHFIKLGELLMDFTSYFYLTFF